MTEQAAASAPSADRLRAQRLLVAGAVGGHAGALVATVVFWVAGGPASGVSCLVACAIALAFYIVGQAVQVMMADAPVQRVLTASLVSYGVRVASLGGLLALAFTQQQRLMRMDPTAVVVGTLTVVVTWLGAEIAAFSRMRIPVFDAPSPNASTPPPPEVTSC